MQRLSLRLAAVLVVIPLAALTSAGSCEAPPRPSEGEGEGEVPGANECDVGGAVMPIPSDESGAAINAQVAGGGEIDLSCIGTPPEVTASTQVRLQGCIDVFGLGDRAKSGITVAVFADGQNPKTDVPEFGEVEIAVQEDVGDLDCAGADANEPACLSLGCDRKGAYAIEGIPTHVPLTMRVSKTGDSTIIDTYSWGIVLDYLDNEAVDGIVTYDANLIYSSTWDSIPTLAGRLIDGGLDVSDGVGRAVIAGEIHDCQDRLVEGASVTTDQTDAITKITYFDGNDEDPKPRLSRLSTNSDGLYVVLNATTDAGSDLHTITAGIVEPGCAGDECACVSLGTRTIRAFPDSVSIVTLRGDFPVVN
jgi:hypothetical protein